MPGRGLRTDGVLGLSPSRTAIAAQRVPDNDHAIDDPLDDLLPRVVAGEPGAVERCLDRYGGLVWSLAQKHFARRAEAEDAVQEAFIALWKNAERFSPSIAKEKTFVVMVARRRMIDLIRRGRTARRSPGESVTPLVDEPLDRSTPPARKLEVAEEAQRARLAMRQLSDDQQRVLSLALGEGRSQSEIAEATGWPIGTVKSHARRGMKRLRELLSESPSPQPTTTQEATR